MGMLVNLADEQYPESRIQLGVSQFHCLCQISLSSKFHLQLLGPKWTPKQDNDSKLWGNGTRRRAFARPPPKGVDGSEANRALQSARFLHGQCIHKQQRSCEASFEPAYVFSKNPVTCSKSTTGGLWYTMYRSPATIGIPLFLESLKPNLRPNFEYAGQGNPAKSRCLQASSLVVKMSSANTSDVLVVRQAS